MQRDSPKATLQGDGRFVPQRGIELLNSQLKHLLATTIFERFIVHTIADIQTCYSMTLATSYDVNMSPHLINL